MKAALAGITELPDGYLCELYQITLKNGATYYRTTHPTPLWWDGNLHGAGDLLFKRGAATSAVGLDVQTCDLEIRPRDETVLLGAENIQTRVNRGDFDNARVIIYRARNSYTVHLFEGIVTDAVADRTQCKLTLSDPKILLDIQMPHKLYQVQCVHTLFGPGCGLAKGAFAVTAAVQAGSTQGVIATGLLQPNGYFDLGSVVFTSGQNAGFGRGIKDHAGGDLKLTSLLPYWPAPGDAFVVYPGCNKLKGTCDNKFSNLPNYLGFPFIPEPEAS